MQHHSAMKSVEGPYYIGRGPWPFIVQFRDHMKETT